jgi:hypothetical protein
MGFDRLHSTRFNSFYSFVKPDENIQYIIFYPGTPNPLSAFAFSFSVFS